MILAKGQYRVMLFLPEYLEKTAALLAKQFTTLNPIWSAFRISEEEAYVVMLRKIRCCINSPHSHLLVNEKDDVLGCNLTVDMVILQKQGTFELPKSPLFSFLAEIEKKLEGELFARKFEPNQAVYGLYMVMAPEVINKKIGQYLSHVHTFNSKMLGVREYYSRVTNPKILAIGKALGVSQINEIVVNLPEKGIHNFKIVLIHLSIHTVITQRAFL